MRNTSEKPRENQCKEWLGETLPKQRNSSRIDAQTVRAQAVRHSSSKNCRNVAYVAYTERTTKLESPASRALGEALPKHSNNIQIRTQAMRNSR